MKKQQLDLRSQVERAGKKPSSAGPNDPLPSLGLKRLHHKSVVKQLFEEIAPQYPDRPGGYTRVLKAGFRKGDNATCFVRTRLRERHQAPGARHQTNRNKTPAAIRCGCFALACKGSVFSNRQRGVR